MQARSQGAFWAAASTAVVLVAVLSGALPGFSVVRLATLVVITTAGTLGLVLALKLSLAVLQDTLARGDDLAELRQDRFTAAFRRLPFTSPASWEAAQIKSRWTSSASKDGSLSPWRQILRIIKRDYILSWYTHISIDGAYPERVEDTILACTRELGKRFERVDVPLLVSTRIVPHVTKHMQDFRLVEALLQPSLHAVPGKNVTVDPGAIVQAHFPSLHPALPIHAISNTAPSVEAYARTKVEGVLRLILPAEECTDTIVTVVREILTCTVLVPMLEWCADPDFWNKLIEEQAGKYLHERQQVSQLRAALETASAKESQAPQRGAVPGPAAQTSPSVGRTRRSTGAISASTTSQQFDAFLKSISKVKSLAEAKHLRNDIERELRSARGETSSSAPSKEQKIYLERLESAERKVIRRIAALGGDVNQDRLGGIAIGGESISLREVLLNPGALGFFMEYMDRRQAAHLLQFWLTVDSFKDPLAGDALSGDEDLVEGARDHQRTKRNLTAWPTAGDDIVALWSTYLSSGHSSTRINLSKRTLQGISSWVQRSPAVSPTESDELLEQAERCVFQAQKEILHAMEEDYFADFRRSELFLKARTEAAPVDQRRVSSTLSQAEREGEAALPMPGQKGTSSSGAALSAFAAWRPFVKSGGDGTPRRAGSAQPQLTPALEVTTPVRQLPLHKARSFSFIMSSRGRQRSAQSSYDRTSRDLSSSQLGPLSPRSTSSYAELGPDPMSLSKVSDDLLPNGRLPKSEEHLPIIEADRIEALQAALTSIIDGSHEEASPPQRLSGLPSRNSGLELLQAFTPSKEIRPGESRKVSESGGLADHPHTSETPSPSQPQNSLGSKPKRVFEDDEDLPDPLPVQAEDVADPVTAEEASQIQLASPGDLCLESDIRFLQRQIVKYSDQDALLDKMVRAAELTGKQHELRLLRRSQSDLRRDMRTMQFQAKQFQQQQLENVLVPSLTKASIARATSSSTDSEKQVVRYTIEMQQLKPTGEVRQCWSVARRYNEFWHLHHELKESVQLSAEMRKKGVDLPSKKLVTFLTDPLIDQRREGLQTYLQRLLSINSACQHISVRRFLSKDRAVPLISIRPSEEGGTVGSKTGKARPGAPAPKFVRNLYKSFQTSMDDVLLGPTAFEVLSERLNRQAGDMADEFGSSLLGWGTAGMEYGSNLIGGGPSLTGQPDLQAILQGNLPSTAGLDAALANLPAMFNTGDSEGGSSVFTGPICDLFIELFSLKNSSWLKKQSAVMIIQQLLGATIERKIRDVVKSLSSVNAIDGHLLHLKETMWPNDGPRAASTARTAQDRAHARARAAKRMRTILPDVPANIVGRRNARRAMERVHSALQVRILNMHLTLTVIDEILHALFPELKK